MHALRLIGSWHFAVPLAPNRHVAGDAVHDLDLELLVASYGAFDFETSMGDGEEGEAENNQKGYCEAHDGGEVMRVSKGTIANGFRSYYVMGRSN